MGVLAAAVAEAASGDLGIPRVYAMADFIVHWFFNNTCKGTFRCCRGI